MLNLIVGFLIGYVLIAFFSYVVARFAFRDAPPLNRAALTAACSWAIASVVTIALRVGLFGDASLTPFLFLLAPALLDCLVMWRTFSSKWVAPEEVADTFN